MKSLLKETSSDPLCDPAELRALLDAVDETERRWEGSGGRQVDSDPRGRGVTFGAMS